MYKPRCEITMILCYYFKRNDNSVKKTIREIEIIGSPNKIKNIK